MTKLRCILLAEDDPRDVELILAALAEQKIANNVVVVRDGAEALDFLHRRGRFRDRDDCLPAVMLLDLKMPKVDGIQVLREVKGDPLLKAIPVVVLTSSRETSDLKECYELGVNSYVVKPVQFPDFMIAVRQLGLFWAVINEPPPPIAIAKATST